jgi:uncharacterized protein (TIGR03435 family)
VAETEVPAYFLTGGNGPLKLEPPAEPDPAQKQSMWLFQENSAPVAALARFLTSVAFCDVVDKTGIQGNYKFNIDLRRELGENMNDIGPGLAMAAAKKYGLRLESGKVPKKKLVIDHLNKAPTPN